jgi:hypothetical protein
MTLVNTIIEKHLIPGVLSIIVMILLFFIIPSDNEMLIKLGNTLFLILLFCIAFVFIEFIIFIINRLKSFNEKRREETMYVGWNIKEQLEQMWKYVNGLSPADRKLLDEFIKSDNKPYIENGNIFHSGNTLLTSELVHKRRISKNSDESQISYTNNDLKFAMYEGMNSKTEYVLKDEVYKLLKYSKEKYGRISHFD